MEEIKQKLKLEIIEALNLQDMQPSDIQDDAPLFGEGLGLDSIDSLELIVLLERNYGIKLDDPKKSREILSTINSMASYISEHSLPA